MATVHFKPSTHGPMLQMLPSFGEKKGKNTPYTWVYYLFIFTSFHQKQKGLISEMVQREFIHSMGYKHRLRESESVNNHFFERTGRFDKTGDTDFFLGIFFHPSDLLFSHSFAGAWGLEAEHKLSLYPWSKAQVGMVRNSIWEEKKAASNCPSTTSP